MILKKTCEKEIREKKPEYEVRISHEAKKNPKLFYSYIGNKKTVRNNRDPLVDNDNKLISDDKDMVSILNSTFSSVFTEEGEADIPTPSNIFQDPDEEKLIITEIQTHKVRKYLQKIDLKKSVGPDEISPRLLKERCAQLKTPITSLFNKSLTQARVPCAWKRANLTTIFKKGEKKQDTNYRPISLTSVLIKLFEKIIRDKTVKFLEKYKLITENQHGFQSNKSCLTNLLDFFNDVYAS